MESSILKRFFDKVQQNHETGCWEWTAGLKGSGRKSKPTYGSFGYKGKNVAAHRFSYFLSKDHSILEHPEIHIMHKCDNPKCVNPDHLQAGTHTDNMQDKIAKNRDHNQVKTHCPSGHPYSGDNLYNHPDGSRKCKACMRAADKIHYEKHKEKIRERKRIQMNARYAANRDKINARRREVLRLKKEGLWHP